MKINVWTSAVLAGVLAAMGTLVAASPAQAKGAEVTGSGTAFYLADTTATTQAETTFTLNARGTSYLVGDWDGAGRDTILLRDGNRFTLPNGTSFTFGTATDQVVAGDWDGDGIDTLAVRRGNVFSATNAPRGTAPQFDVAYGRPTDTVFIGDWDGNGTDTPMVRRENVNHVKNSFSGGDADVVAAYGWAGDRVHVGDWDGDGADTTMVRRGNVNHLKNSLGGGPADVVVAFGRATDTLLVGDWTGTGATLGMVRQGFVETRISPSVASLPVPAARVAATLTPSPVTFGSGGGWYDGVLPPAAIGYRFTSVSASLPHTVSILVDGGRGTTVELQRSTDGGATWAAVASAVPSSGSQHVDLTVPPTNANLTAQYRVVAPMQNGHEAAVGPTQTLTHYLVAGLPASDPRRPISDIVRPYCQNVPISYDGGANGWLRTSGSATDAAGMAYSAQGMGLYQIVLANKVKDSYRITGDDWVTHVALHECGHVAAYRYLGDGYAEALRQAYPDSVINASGTTRDEAIANALAHHWARNNPGGNTASAFKPRGGDGRTWMDRLKATGDQPWRTWLIDYRGDDALVARLTSQAMTGR